MSATPRPGTLLSSSLWPSRAPVPLTTSPSYTAISGPRRSPSRNSWSPTPAHKPIHRTPRRGPFSQTDVGLLGGLGRRIHRVHQTIVPLWRHRAPSDGEYIFDLQALANHRQRDLVIYASAAATYGDGSHGMDDMNPAIERLRPLNMYGYSKHLFDLYARRKGWLERIVGLKYFNVFGPNEEHKGDMRSVVCKAHAQIRDSGRIGLFRSYDPRYKDGEQMRDFLYVKDAVEMTLHFAGKGATASGLFNLGSGQANTWLTLAGAIFS